MFGSLTLVNGVSVGHTHSSFSVCNDRGFAFYASDPIKLKFARDFGRGILFADQWQDSNIIVLVGGGNNPMFEANTVVVWNDQKEVVIGKQMFEGEIKNILTTHSRLIVALENRVYIYKFPPVLDISAFSLKEVGHYDTISNPKGLFSALTTSSRTYVAMPGEVLGSVRIIIEEKSSLQAIGFDINSPAQFDRISLFENQKDKCLMLAISVGGGCYIDVWDVLHKSFLIKYSRSLNPAKDVHFGWDPSGRYLCVSTEKKILRYFDLSLCKNPDQNQQGYIMRSNFAKYQIELDEIGAFQTRCWFTRQSSRLIVARINSERELVNYDIFNEIIPSQDGTASPLPLASYIVCDADTSFQTIRT